MLLCTLFLPTDNNILFYQKVALQFNKKVLLPIPKPGKKSENIPTTKPVVFSNFPPSPVLSRPLKEDLSKSCFHSKKAQDQHGNCIHKHLLLMLRKFSN